MDVVVAVLVEVDVLVGRTGVLVDVLVLTGVFVRVDVLVNVAVG